MKTILLILIAFTTLSSVALCRNTRQPRTVEISAANNFAHNITVKASLRTGGSGEPVQSEERIVTVSLPNTKSTFPLPITKSDRKLGNVSLIFEGLSAPLAISRSEDLATVSFSIVLKHLKHARIDALYSNDKDNSVDVIYSVQLKSFIPDNNEPQKDAEQAGTRQPDTRPESKSEGSDKPQPEAEGRSR